MMSLCGSSLSSSMLLFPITIVLHKSVHGNCLFRLQPTVIPTRMQEGLAPCTLP
jgi:hypothetical protein